MKRKFTLMHICWFIFKVQQIISRKKLMLNNFLFFIFGFQWSRNRTAIVWARQTTVKPKCSTWQRFLVEMRKIGSILPTMLRKRAMLAGFARLRYNHYRHCQIRDCLALSKQRNIVSSKNSWWPLFLFISLLIVQFQVFTFQSGSRLITKEKLF